MVLKDITIPAKLEKIPPNKITPDKVNYIAIFLHV